MDFDTLVPLTKKVKKRKASSFDIDEDSSSENERQSCNKAKLLPRKRRQPAYPSLSDEEIDTGSSCLESPSSDPGTYPANKEMDFKLPEPLKERTKKRKANKHEEDEDSNSDLESETSSCSKAKKHPPSTRSYDTTSSINEAKRDSKRLGSPLQSRGDGNFSASKWKYTDLQFLHIFYEKTPESLENFMKEVKDAFKKNKDFCPDPSKMTKVLKKHLENLTFSYDLKYLRDQREYGSPLTVICKVQKEMEKYFQLTWKKLQEMLQKNQFYQALDSSTKEKAQELIFSLSFPMKAFAAETLRLVQKILYGRQEETQSSSEETERGKGKERRGRATVQYRGSTGHRVDPKTFVTGTTENFFQKYCEKFGRLFFLDTGEVLQGSFSFKNRIVRNTPDVVYHYLANCEYPGEGLMFIVEAKKAAVSEEGATHLEELIGENIMGQVGAELFGQSQRSVFYPMSLGIVCMETKLIFVFLKISEEHSVGIRKGERGSADDPGKIMYTEPFDMLKQEDRLKMAEFLYWLGFVQDLRKYDFL